MVAKQILKNNKKIKLLYGKRDHKNHELLEKIIEEMGDKQVIIMDINRVWQPDINKLRTHFLRPQTREEVFKTIVDLPMYISPRLELIIIDGILQFFRDFLGRTAKDFAVNKKLYAACICILSNIVNEYDIKVIITSHQGFDNKAVMSEINYYYNIDEINTIL